MTPEQEEKIKKIFSESRSFAVICDGHADEGTLLAKEGLVSAIRSAKRPVYQFPPRAERFAQKWSSILPPAEDFPFIYATSILIPKNKVETKEISYAEDDKNISINITSAKENITKENTIFKTIPSEVGAMFYFTEYDHGRLDEETLNEISSKISAPPEDRLVIITSERNRSHDPLAVKVFDIIEAAEIKDSASKTLVPDLLLGSLAFETDYFKKNLSAKAIEVVASLSGMGADKGKIDAAINIKDSSFVKLLGRAMARSAPNQSLKSVWTFLSEQDLEKTGNLGADENIFYELMLKMKELILNDFQNALILLWQKKESVWANILLNRAEEKTAKALLAALAARKKTGYLTCGPYKNFSEAELKIQNALKESM